MEEGPVVIVKAPARDGRWFVDGLAVSAVDYGRPFATEEAARAYAASLVGQVVS